MRVDRFRPALIAGGLAAVLGWAAAAAQAGPIDMDQAMRDSQAALGRSVGNHRFIDHRGQPLELARLRGRPLVLSFVYTSCAFVCPTLTTQLARAVEVAHEVLGEGRFGVVTVGFDTRVDTPAQMRRYAVERGIDDADWYFASADQATIDRLAADAGFTYAPVGGAFDHLSQVTILDADGRVYRQVYGMEFEPPLVVDPLKKLVLGIDTPERPLAGFIDKVRLLCTSYDPKSGRYRFDYSLLLEIAIGLSLAAGMSFFVWRSWRQGRAVPGGRA